MSTTHEIPAHIVATAILASYPLRMRRGYEGKLVYIGLGAEGTARATLEIDGAEVVFAGVWTFEHYDNRYSVSFRLTSEGGHSITNGVVIGNSGVRLASHADCLHVESPSKVINKEI